MNIVDWFQVDPALPALALSFDTAAIAQLFTNCWAQVGSVDQDVAVVQGCRLQEIHYQPAAQCIGTYELVVRTHGQKPHTTIGVVEVRPEGCRPRLYAEDVQLPWLAAASNPWVMQTRLQALFAGLQGTQVTPVRYKPGARCMLQYRLAHDTGQSVLFGKLLAHDGAALWHTFRALAQASQLDPALPRTPPVVAYWPDWHMLLQGAVNGVELHTFAFDHTIAVHHRQAWLHKAGQAIAALHRCTTLSGPHRTLAADLMELYEYQTLMAQINPRLAARYATTLEALDHLADTCVEPAFVPSHGALRTDQFLVEQDQLVLIDLDSFCWANPARDLGNFLAYLRWKAMRQPHLATFIEQAQREFCQAYAATGALLEQGWLAVYQTLSMLKIIGRRFRGLTYQEWPLSERLLTTAHTLLTSVNS